MLSSALYTCNSFGRRPDVSHAGCRQGLWVNTPHPNVRWAALRLLKSFSKWNISHRPHTRARARQCTAIKKRTLTNRCVFLICLMCIHYTVWKLKYFFYIKKKKSRTNQRESATHAHKECNRFLLFPKVINSWQQNRNEWWQTCADDILWNFKFTILNCIFINITNAAELMQQVRPFALIIYSNVDVYSRNSRSKNWWKGRGRDRERERGEGGSESDNKKFAMPTPAWRSLCWQISGDFIRIGTGKWPHKGITSVWVCVCAWKATPTPRTENG